MLHARILRSPHAHAKIVSIDTSAAERMPGVVDREPEEGRSCGTTARRSSRSRHRRAPPPRTRSSAVKVAYDVLPHTVSLAAARKEGAPLVFQKPVEEKRSAGDEPGAAAAVAQTGNVRGPKTSGRGDAEKGFAEAEGTLEVVTTTSVQTHVPLETHSLFAEWTGDTLEVHASTQGTFSVRDELAEVFKLSKDKVVVHAEFTGGGFGAKFGAGDYGVFAAKLAKKAGKPVLMALDRKEEHLAAGNRPDSWNRVKLGYKKDGTVTAVDYESFGTAGVATGTGTGGFVKSAYGFPAVKVAESDVFTHLGPGCAMRAPGHPQGCFAVETALEELASRLGMDPLALRLKNDPSEVRRAEWDDRGEGDRLVAPRGITKANEAAAAAGSPLRRGLGCAAAAWYTFVAPGSQVLVRIHRDGTVEVENGVQDIGGGPRTPIAMVVAEELGLPVERIRVKIGDSRYPFGPASGGSVTTGSLIPAVRAAAVHAREKLLGRRLEGPRRPRIRRRAREWSLLREGQDRRVPEGLRAPPGETLVATGDRAKDYDGTDTRLFGAQFAEVVVDVETGVVAVKKVVAVHDCGQPVWKTGVESQIRGGVLQGISYALFEERIVDERSGRVLNPNVEFYKILGSKDTPEIVPIVVDLYPGKNNAHARGIGEPATVPTAAAVANAIAHATGIRPTALPITPARILDAAREGPEAGGEGMKSFERLQPKSWEDAASSWPRKREGRRRFLLR